MNFKTFAPPPVLQPYVKYFYVIEAGHGVNEAKSFRTIADGCPGIMFQKRDDGYFVQNDKQLPSGFLFGQSTKHTDLYVKGAFNAIGVYLQPNALRTIFGINAELLTDSCLDLDLFSKKDIRFSETLDDACDVADKIDIISAYLIKKLDQNRSAEDGVLRYAVEKISASNGQLSLAALRNDLRLSERTFERNFKQYVGISPKLFSRICCFQASLKQLNRSDFNKLSDIAYQNNYADQSHFIRSFKQFSGFSPNQYQNKSTEIVENLSELIS